MKVDPKSSSPIIITSTRSREWCTVWNPIWMIRWDKMRCYQLIKKIGHHLDLIHKLMFRAPARIGLHAVYIYVHTNSGATALVDSWQFSTMNSVRWKKKDFYYCFLCQYLEVGWSQTSSTGCPKWSVRLKSQGTGFDAFSPGKKKRDFRLLPTLRQQLTKENKNREKRFLFWRWSVFKTVVFLAPLVIWSYKNISTRGLNRADVMIC